MSDASRQDSVFVARQPIWDRRRRVIGYELLYRAGDENLATVIDGDIATTEVLINSILGVGLDRLVGNHTAYYNVTASFIRGDYALPLDQDRSVLEVLEDIAPDQDVLSGITALRQSGFTIALDDFEYSDNLIPLLELADIVKLEVLGREPDQIRQHVERLAGYNVTLLAEKVETHDAFRTCQELGFHRFQGFFFCQPDVVKGQSVASNRLVILKLIARLQDPTVELAELQELIIQDVTLTYRLLRYINSAAIGMSRRVESVHRALALIGMDRIRNWASLLLMTRMDDKPPELIRIALIRGRMAALISQRLSNTEPDQSFTAGLLSVIDALMDRPMAELIEPLPLTTAVQEALISRGGDLGEVLKATIAYEQGLWDAPSLQLLAAEELSQLYLNALAWADGTMNGLAATS